MKLITKQSEPVIFTDNTTNISFDGLQYNDHAETLISDTGERSQNISIAHIDTSKAKKVKGIFKEKPRTRAWSFMGVNNNFRIADNKRKFYAGRMLSRFKTTERLRPE
ncbi:hypothetical protein [Dyadobacter sp. BHUBP1]|uniref:hypothetical protein n=1 Tax=Dyadobacter sp. BHUBP1 TaxID=3424178 RepID=UPI003D350F24